MTNPGPLFAKGGVRWSVTEILLALTLAAAILFGGTAKMPVVSISLIFVTSSALAAWVMSHGAVRAFSALPLLTRVFLLLVPLLWLVQLIPLPPTIWGMLPGRDLPTRIFELLGTEDEFHPLSLTPYQTFFRLVMLLPPAAVFAAALTLDKRGRERCIAIVVALAALSIVVGLLQVTSRGALLNFYNSDHHKNLVGFFTNRNHQGLFIAITGAFAVDLIHRRLADPRKALATALIIAMMFFTAAVGTLSRAGLTLTSVGLSTIGLLLFAHNWSRQRYFRVGIALLAVPTAFYALSFNPVVERTLARFGDVSDDGRWEIWKLSFPLLRQYMPWGSGFGSFVDSYRVIEQLGDVVPKYVNHAHNDYLEFVIEAGVPAIVLLGLFALAMIRAGGAVGRAGSNRAAFSLSAGLAIGLAAAHSIVDYPLRTTAIASLFALAMAFFMSDQAPERARRRSSRSKSVRDLS